MDFSNLLPLFVAESMDNLAQFENDLMAISSDEPTPDKIDSLFRTVHSIKGGAGIYDAGPVVDLAHAAESALDLVRKNTLPFSITLAELLFTTKDRLEAYMQALEAGTLTSADSDLELIGRLDALTPDDVEQIAVSSVANVNTQSAAIPDSIATSDGSIQTTSDTRINAIPPLAEKVVKVNAHKVDCLVDEVGELVTLKYQIKTLLEQTPNPDMALIKLFDKSIDQLRDTALSMRLIPLGERFNRFYRVVQEAAKATKKQIALSIHGADIELDRLTIEKLIDPLTHIVRNSCDHGIEMPEQRSLNGKDTEGKITISARYNGAKVLVSIADDGAGLNRQKILKKAVESGLVEDEQSVSDQQVYEFIFHAGLSTADTLSELSGRGVGMDVVRQNIEALGGDIQIHSKAGQGTRFDIHLPLTTAIIDGFAVMVGATMLVLPRDNIDECIANKELAKFKVEHEQCIALRGDYIPIINLADKLAIEKNNQHQEALIVYSKQGRIALGVDALLGEFQAVVKPLDPLLKRAKAFSGIVKMASGDIGFCLDINKLVSEH